MNKYIGGIHMNRKELKNLKQVFVIDYPEILDNGVIWYLLDPSCDIYYTPDLVDGHVLSSETFKRYPAFQCYGDEINDEFEIRKTLNLKAYTYRKTEHQMLATSDDGKFYACYRADGELRVIQYLGTIFCTGGKTTESKVFRKLVNVSDTSPMKLNISKIKKYYPRATTRGQLFCTEDQKMLTEFAKVVKAVHEHFMITGRAEDPETLIPELLQWVYPNH